MCHGCIHMYVCICMSVYIPNNKCRDLVGWLEGETEIKEQRETHRGRDGGGCVTTLAGTVNLSHSQLGVAGCSAPLSSPFPAFPSSHFPIFLSCFPLTVQPRGRGDPLLIECDETLVTCLFTFRRSFSLFPLRPRLPRPLNIWQQVCYWWTVCYSSVVQD